jgi:hypothetical protein
LAVYQNAAESFPLDERFKAVSDASTIFDEYVQECWLRDEAEGWGWGLMLLQVHIWAPSR